MLNEFPQVLADMQARFGNSREESRNVVIEAHGGIEKLKEVAALWAENHYIAGTDKDIVIAYATAVDLGCRIGLLPEKEPAETD